MDKEHNGSIVVGNVFNDIVSNAVLWLVEKCFGWWTEKLTAVLVLMSDVIL